MQDIIRGHEEYFTVQADGRTICTLNQHVFKRPQDLQAFISGSKYKQLRSAAELDCQLKRLVPYITASKNFPGKMFCTLTCHIINRNLVNVSNHVAGRRYRLAKESHAKGELELFVEPDEPESEESDGMDADEPGTQPRMVNNEEVAGMSLEPSQQGAGADQEQLVVRPQGMSKSLSRCRQSRPKRARRES